MSLRAASALAEATCVAPAASRSATRSALRCTVSASGWPLAKQVLRHAVAHHSRCADESDALHVQSPAGWAALCGADPAAPTSGSFWYSVAREMPSSRAAASLLPPVRCSAWWMARASSSATACGSGSGSGAGGVRSAAAPAVAGMACADGCHRPPRCRAAPRSARSAPKCAAPSTQVVGHQRRLLQHVAQLADVARPVVPRQQLQRVGVQALVRQAAAPRDVLGQRLDQRLQVVEPLAQRRQADRQHVEAVVQVGAEAARRPPSPAGRGWWRR